MQNDIYVGIRKVPGGFIVETQFGTQVEKTLNKALAVAKVQLTPEVTHAKDTLENPAS